MSDGDLVIYRTDDGTAEFYLREISGTVWMSQKEISELFQVTPQAVTQHVKAIYDEGELLEETTCKRDLQVQTEGTRKVSRQIRTIACQ